MLCAAQRNSEVDSEGTLLSAVAIDQALGSEPIQMSTTMNSGFAGMDPLHWICRSLESMSWTVKNQRSIPRTFPFLDENIVEDTIKRAAEVSDASIFGGSDDAGQDICFPPRFLQLDQEGNWDRFYFRAKIRILLSYSFIKKAATRCSYFFHPLVHSWSRDSEIITRSLSLSCE
jgi:hypothetical protein